MICFGLRVGRLGHRRLQHLPRYFFGFWVALGVLGTKSHPAGQFAIILKRDN